MQSNVSTNILKVSLDTMIPSLFVFHYSYTAVEIKYNLNSSLCVKPFLKHKL